MDRDLDNGPHQGDVHVHHHLLQPNHHHHRPLLHLDDRDLDPNANGHGHGHSSVSLAGSRPGDPRDSHHPHPQHPQHHHHAHADAGAPLNPDDFYRNLGHDTLPLVDAMASSLPRPPLRTNGDATPPIYPPASANRMPTRVPNVRSVSSPLDTRTTPVRAKPPTPAGKTSVKDLKKRFDADSASSPVPRPPVRPATRVKKDGVAGSPSNASTPYMSLRAGSTHDRSPQASATKQPAYAPRSRVFAEDHVSSNPQSFASRIGKPRGSMPGNSISSKSMTNLPHPSPPHLPQPPPPPPLSPPTSSRPHALLFGEIPPDQFHAPVLGHGIEGVRPRRTSESGLHPLKTHNRSFSDADLEPSSPSNWYRDANEHTGSPKPKKSASSKHHARSRSDAATFTSTVPLIREPNIRQTPTPAPNIPSAASKLPVSVRKLSSPSASSSPASTRSNSPSTQKRPHVNGKSSRAGTPTSRAKTPTRPNAGRKATTTTPKPSTANSSRLQAYVAAPSPKLSPPLRSSRPRQPVSMATTASSRMRAVERGKSPTKSSTRTATKPSEAASRRRKLSVGPIDFEQRREHIRLAYSKSIRESQVLEARQQAAERKRREAEEAANAAAELAAVLPVTASSDNSPAGQDGLAEVLPTDTYKGVPERVMKNTKDPENLASPTSETESLPPASDVVAVIRNKPKEATQVALASPTSAEQQPAPSPTLKTFNSPTLGLPGSFPALSPPMNTDEPPMSAISTTSDTTEFDIEPQINPPVEVNSSYHEPSLAHSSPDRRDVSPPKVRLEYRDPFDDSSEPDSPCSTDLQASDVHHTAVPNLTQRHYSIPGAFHSENVNGLGLVLDAQHGQEPTITVDEPSQADMVNTTGPERLPFPRLEVDGESECQTDVEDDQYLGHDNEDAITDVCTEDTDDPEPRMGYATQSPPAAPTSSQRSSICESVDPGSANEVESSTRGDHHATGLSDHLLDPPSIPSGDRLSHLSTWTDMSVSSVEPTNTASSSRPESIDYSGHGSATIYGTTISGRQSQVSVTGTPYSFSGVRSPVDSTRSSAYYGQHQLPELDTGDGFSIACLSPESISGELSSIPVPDHEPPPIPTPAPSSAAGSIRRASTLYEQSHYASTLVESTRDSNDYLSPAETNQSLPQSVHARSVEEQSIANSDDKSIRQSHEEVNGKERHRLVQRRNVIKELVDTEAVFVRDMNIVEEIYKGTAEACPKLDDKTVKLIFRNTDEIIDFHTIFLTQLKEAVAKVYVPKGARSRASREDSMISESSHASVHEFNDARDREVLLGPVFMSNVEKMKLAHEGFLRTSDQAAKRLIQIQQDPTVKVWLNECNEVAKDLTAAWDLDSLLIKPMQRITKYPNLIITLLQHTPKDHPDRDALVSAKDVLETAIIEINKTKKNFELVGQIVGRKRKESDVKAGFARAFGKRVDKLQTSNNRSVEDPVYAKLNEKFGDDYLRLQVVLRDVEFYTRQVATYVREFLQYLSSIELVMRLQPGSYPELESKWVQFNISVRDLEKVALEEHLSQVRKHVIEPFELVIKAYGNPSLAMKKRQKRRVDYERSEQLKRAGKSVDAKLNELVEQYEALNDTLKKELPQLSALTEKIGNICLSNFVNIQTNWYKIWKDKMKAIMPDCAEMPDLKEVVSTFQRDFPYVQEQVSHIGMLNPAYRGRMSQSTTDGDESIMRGRPRPSALDTRSRGQSLNVDSAPTLPTPDFARRSSGSFTMSPGLESKGLPSPHQYYYRDYYSGLQAASVANPVPPVSPEAVGSSLRSMAGTTTGAASTRPSTGWSYESGALTRQSSDIPSLSRRDSNNTAHSSAYTTHDNRRFSGLFQSALPLPDGPEEGVHSSRASSRERWSTVDSYNVLWLAASLFEFNIATTKHEAGYPYLIYQAGEIFDVIGEKGELWLAKNQDDETEQVGWIWSKHFAKLADS